MLREISLCPALRGEITPPGDKSVSHRAVMLNGIAQGKARLSNFSPGADCASTVVCLQALGVKVTRTSSDPLSVEVEGVGRGGLREADDILDAGNSGTTMRLLTGLLVGQPFLSIITGDGSLRSRPMDRIVRPLALMGARIWGRGRDSFGPLAIKGGGLHGIDYDLPVPSAQVKSALLIAALFAEGDTTIHEPSKSRDHTERLLQAMGSRLKVDGLHISLTPEMIDLRPVDLDIPGDISSAAYWLVAAASHPDAEIRIKNTGVNPTRTGVVDVLRKMGADLRIENERQVGGEPVADLLARSSQLRGVEVGGEFIPRLIDEIPAIAVAACTAHGRTVIRDAAELRVKETDRIRHLVMELSKLGAKVEELPDGMVIEGRSKLSGGECSSHGDHRLAMALGIAGLIAGGRTVVEGAEVAEVSYPNFWQDMGRIRAD